MSYRTQNILTIVGLIIIFILAGLPAAKAQNMNLRATGEFDVKLDPKGEDKSELGTLARMSLDKQFRGDLVGTSKGEMLTAMAPLKGSGVYVAVERVNGTLAGRSGSFMLHHTGVMTRGTPSLSINVVPDSGTGQLAGLSGKLAIRIDGGKHFYDFDYSIAP
jgi:hypothetical protein